MAQLAAVTSTNTAKVDNYLESHGLPGPSFDVDAPLDLGIPQEATDIEDARKVTLEATIELQDLLQGSTSLLRPVVCGEGAGSLSLVPQIASMYHVLKIIAKRNESPSDIQI